MKIFLIIFIILLSSNSFSHHNYDLGLNLSDVCTKEDGILYYSEGENLSICKPYGVIIDDYKKENISTEIGIKKGDIIVEFDNVKIRSFKSVDNRIKNSKNKHTHTILIKRWNEKKLILEEIKINFLIQNKTAVLISDKEAQENKKVLLDNNFYRQNEVYVNTNLIHLRDNPNGSTTNKNGWKIGNLYFNEKVIIYDISNDATWLLVVTPSEKKVGWAPSEFFSHQLSKIDKFKKKEVDTYLTELRDLYNFNSKTNIDHVIFDCYDYQDYNLQHLRYGINLNNGEVNFEWKFRNQELKKYKSKIIAINDPLELIGGEFEGWSRDVWFRNPLSNKTPDSAKERLNAFGAKEWWDSNGIWQFRLGDIDYFPKISIGGSDPPFTDPKDQWRFITGASYMIGLDKISLKHSDNINAFHGRDWNYFNTFNTATGKTDELTCVARQLPFSGTEYFYWPSIDDWESSLPKCDPPIMANFEHSHTGTGKWKNCFGRSVWFDSQTNQKSMYEGEHNEKGKWHGRGTICYENGERWEGEFVDGYQSRGTLIQNSKTYWDGVWEYNKPTNLKRYPDGKIVLLKDLPTDYKYLGVCNEKWPALEIRQPKQNSDFNDPPYCNKNRHLFCSAQRLVDQCSSYENYNKNLFNNCMKGVDDIGNTLKAYGLTNSEIVNGIASCNCN